MAYLSFGLFLFSLCAALSAPALSYRHIPFMPERSSISLYSWLFWFWFWFIVWFLLWWMSLQPFLLVDDCTVCEFVEQVLVGMTAPDVVLTEEVLTGSYAHVKFFCMALTEHYCTSNEKNIRKVTAKAIPISFATSITTSPLPP